MYRRPIITYDGILTKSQRLPSVVISTSRELNTTSGQPLIERRLITPIFISTRNDPRIQFRSRCCVTPHVRCIFNNSRNLTTLNARLIKPSVALHVIFIPIKTATVECLISRWDQYLTLRVKFLWVLERSYRHWLSQHNTSSINNPITINKKPYVHYYIQSSKPVPYNLTDGIKSLKYVDNNNLVKFLPILVIIHTPLISINHLKPWAY